MKIVCAEDFYGEQITDYLKNQMTSGKRYLYIARAEVLKERGKNKDLSPCFADSANHFYNLTAHINGLVYKENNYLSQTDMYYILKKTVDFYFADDEKKHTVYKNMYYQIFELYKFLMFHNIVPLSEEAKETLKETHTEDGFVLFDLYGLYKTIIDKTISAVQSGATSYKIDELDITLSVTPKNAKNYDTFIAIQKKKINEILSNVDVLFIDGYFIFNDLESYLLSAAKSLNKEIVFVTKNLDNDIYKGTIITGAFANAANEKETPEIITFSSDNKKAKKTGLSYIKDNFYTVAAKVEPKISKLFNDGSINIFEPFVSRHDELNFIAAKVGELIKEHKKSETTDAESFIENEIMLTSPLRKDVIARLTDETFKRTGYFTYREKPRKLFEDEVDETSFEKGYYDIKDFISADVLFENGQYLSHTEKSKFFADNFKRIKITTPKDSLANMPVLDFVFQLYDISTKGITPKRFKALLLSNWYYHIGESEIIWDEYVGIFGKIEVYFENITDLPDWIKTIEQIADLRQEIITKPNYKFHPFNAVSEKDLTVITNILKEIKLLSDMIADVSGNLQKHLDLLREKIKIGKILDISDEDLTAEQAVIKTFYELIQNMTGRSGIQNFDSAFFVGHLKNIIANTERETDEYERDANNYNLTMTNILNLKKHKYVFAIGMEADKFPRKKSFRYPFTKEVIEVIEDLGVKSQELHFLKPENNLDEFSFKNMVDFVEDKLFFSITEYENRKKNEFSVFVEDIATCFNSDIITCVANKPEYAAYKPGLSETKPVFCPNKKVYSVKELATFKLCPHLYFYLHGFKSRLAYCDNYQLRLFADNLMYINLMDDFMEYNRQNNRYYSIGNDEIYDVLKKVANESFDNTLRFFDLFNDFDITEMKSKALERAINFITESAVGYAKYPIYSIRKVAPKFYDCGDFTLCVEYDTAIIGKGQNEKRISQNKLYLDFLVMKSNDVKLDITHYADMLRTLQQNKGYVDRVFLIKRIIDKINIQFDSVRFEDDGKERAKEIVREIRNTDFSTVNPYTSNFCGYCIMRDACRFDKQTVREV